MSSKYIVIYKQLKKSILEGIYPAQTPLPSSRILAKNLGVSRNTILEAFAHLEDEGYVEGIHGSGVYVKNLPKVHLNLWDDQKKQEHFRYEKLQTKNLNPFKPGEPDVSLFPFHLFSKISGICYRELRNTHYYYEDSLGFLPLREAIAGYLTLKRQVNCHAEQIMIVNGSQEAIFLCGQILIQKNTKVFLEDPSYKLARRIFEERQARVYPIPVDHNGMQIEKITPDKNSIVYITPSHQFPLGSTMSIERRLKLLEMAQDNDMSIMEDDYDSDFRYTGEPLSSLQGIGSADHVIYIGTLSKIFFPAIRIGFCVLPYKFIDQFLDKRKLMNRQPAIMNQAVVAHFMEKGYIYKHIKKMHTIYKMRRDFLYSIVQKKLSAYLTIKISDSGLHLVAFFKNKYDKNVLKNKAIKMKLNLIFISDYCHNEINEDGFVLGFSTFETKVLEKAVCDLLEVFKS